MKLKTEQSLIFVTATRISGTNDKGNPYDFAHVEVSDGIGSLEFPIEPALADYANNTFTRGEKVSLVVDARKNFGKTQFIVTKIETATATK